MLSLLNLMILCPDADSVEDFAYFGSVGASPVDDLISSLSIPSFAIGFPLSPTTLCLHEEVENDGISNHHPSENAIILVAREKNKKTQAREVLVPVG